MNTPARRLVSAWMHERRRLAGRLHAGPQQDLAVAALEVGRLLRAAGAGEQRDTLAGVAAELERLQAALRALAAELYPPALAGHGLPAALEAEASRAPVALRLAVDVPARLPDGVEAVVLLCVRVAVDNVARHAQMDAATVEVTSAAGAVRLAVRDDGVGFDPGRVALGGLGVARDLLEALGGELRLHSAPGQGTTVTGEVPAGAEDEGAP